MAILPPDAEGATRPESLRQKDHTGKLLWREIERNLNPPKGLSSQATKTEGRHQWHGLSHAIYVAFFTLMTRR